MTKSRSPLVSAFAGTLTATAVPAIAGIASSVTLARTLDPFGRGEMAAVFLWTLALGILGDLGVGFALTYFVSRDPDSVSGLWTLGLLVAVIFGGFLAAAGGVLLAPLLSLSPEALLALRLTLVGVPLTMMTGYGCSLLLGGGRLGASNIVRGEGLVLYSASVLGLALAGRGRILSYAAAWLLAQAAVSITAAILVHRKLGAGWRWQPRLVRPVFSYGIRVHAGALAGQILLRLDQLIMSALGLTAQLGFYVVAVAVASASGPFFNALAILALQRVTASASAFDAGLEASRIIRIGLWLGVPLIAAAVVVAGPLIPVVFGGPYAMAALPARLLLLASFFQGVNAILGNGLRGLGLPGRTAVSEGAGSLVTVALLFLLLPRYGATGAALASLLASGLVSFVQFRFLSQKTRLSIRACLGKGAGASRVPVAGAGGPRESFHE